MTSKKHTDPAILAGSIITNQRPLTERPYALLFKGEKSRTQQHQKNQCNPNTIMENYNRTGILKASGNQIPNFGKQTSIELKDALQTVITAETAFNSLPPETRAKFKNDPGQLLDFVNDPSTTTDQLVELGLAEKSKSAPKQVAAPSAAPAPGAPPVPPPAEPIPAPAPVPVTEKAETSA